MKVKVIQLFSLPGRKKVFSVKSRHAASQMLTWYVLQHKKYRAAKSNRDVSSVRALPAWDLRQQPHKSIVQHRSMVKRVSWHHKSILHVIYFLCQLLIIFGCVIKQYYPPPVRPSRDAATIVLFRSVCLSCLSGPKATSKYLVRASASACVRACVRACVESDGECERRPMLPISCTGGLGKGKNWARIKKFYWKKK